MGNSKLLVLALLVAPGAGDDPEGSRIIFHRRRLAAAVSEIDPIALIAEAIHFAAVVFKEVGNFIGLVVLRWRI